MITLYWLAFYVAISLASIQFVRFAGPLAIGPCYRIEELYDSDSGKLNVAYRILAPTVCCEIPVLALVAACNASNLPGPTLRFLPTALYWLFLGVIKLTNNTLVDRLLPFLGEAFISQLLALAFDHFVIGGYIGSQGVNVFDNSSIAFQFELAIFGVATCWISTLLMRLQAKSHLHSPFPKTTHGGSYYSLVDTTEAKLFSYEREFGELLPQRFTNDILLRSVFFAIMAIEDVNRPSFIRTIERLAARLNLAKTTGIMQQTCAHPLSDRDSVELAILFWKECGTVISPNTHGLPRGLATKQFASIRTITPMTIKCCHAQSAIISGHSMATTAEQGSLTHLEFCAMFSILRKGNIIAFSPKRYLPLDQFARPSSDGFLESVVFGQTTKQSHHASQRRLAAA